jgi:cysteine desulfurase
MTRAREQVSALIGCQPDEIVFTSGGTEANNLAIRGVAYTSERRRIVTTVIEHPATLRPCERLAEQSAMDVIRLGVDLEGRARLDEAERAIDAETALVTVMHSNNETGVLQPVTELAALAGEHASLVHCDAAQSVGKVAIDVRTLGVDLLSIAGHKLYAPKGVGALYVKRGVKLTPLVLGAGHERGLRPGTENVASIVGLGVACEVLGRDLAAAEQRIAGLRDELWQRLASEVPGLALNGHAVLRLPNTLNVRFPRVSGEKLLSFAPDVAASTGSACHEGHEQASAVIVAMGVPPDRALGSVRLTLGRSTTHDDVMRASHCLVAAYRLALG